MQIVRRALLLFLSYVRYCCDIETVPQGEEVCLAVAVGSYVQQRNSNLRDYLGRRDSHIRND